MRSPITDAAEERMFSHDDQVAFVKSTNDAPSMKGYIHGHPEWARIRDERSAQLGRYEAAGRAIGKLVDTKNTAYGDSARRSGAIMRVLFPDGIPADRYEDVLTIVRVIDKLSRVATDNDPFGESPWTDIAGYALLAAERRGGNS